MAAGPPADANPDKMIGAYRSSTEYGGAQGITLGTAMAISGAATSPNMGYHSSPAITFLMTILNVRLGWWLGNPGARVRPLTPTRDRRRRSFRCCTRRWA